MAEPLHRLAALAAAHPDAPAFHAPDETVGWADFAQRVGGWARTLAGGPPFLGLLAGNGIDWAAIDLAAGIAGVTFVPLPGFFSDEQLARLAELPGGIRIIADADRMDRARRLFPDAEPVGAPRARLPGRSAGGGRLIFTSGSTGSPKGVMLSAGQVEASAAAIAAACEATKEDRNLSLLPLPLLLEQITAIYVPLLAGIATTFDPLPFPAATGADIAARIARRRPTTTVLVPELLAGWVAALESAGARAPRELRFVAVGGAAVPETLAARAVARGIPVHEGYGLTECCSVVAVNRPGSRRPGTVGPPLPGVEVRIEDGEIVVAGPTVMDAYLGGACANGVWRTGDLGALDADGFLTVHGRRDDLIVTALGRNIAPEWVETTLLSDSALAFCVVADTGEARPGVVIVPAPGVSRDAARAAARRAAGALPEYARPGRMVVTARAALARDGLLSPNGRPRRRAFADWLRDRAAAAPALTE
jgi:long-subunit acyl-CoA synthetase (AMP-forming)